MVRHQYTDGPASAISLIADRPRSIDLATHVAGLAAMWLAYAWVRSITAGAEIQAIENAARLLDLESTFGLSVEADLQSAVQSPRMFYAANVYYLLHFPITIALLVAAFVRDRHHTFSTLRNALIAVTTVALTLHIAIPLAPPRMLEGFIDAGATYGPDPYAIPGSDGANQFAALPSLHVAWAVLVAYAAGQLVTRRSLKLLAVAHPIATSAVVVTTGHHFVADAMIGAGLAATALIVFSRANHRHSNLGGTRLHHEEATR